MSKSCFESRDTSFGGNSPMPKGLAMEKFPRADTVQPIRLGHPIHPAGLAGTQRKRIKSHPRKGK